MAEKRGAHKQTIWKRKIDFLFNMAGMAISLGNIWRFPYLCYRNGGGSFLIPYIIFVLLSAFPMMTLEVSLGQLTGSSGPNAWKIVPLMKGIGFGTLVIQGLLSIYYPVILAWALRYFLASFSSTLPWTTCDNNWNTENCFEYLNIGQGSRNGSLQNFTHMGNTSSSSSLEFWRFGILGTTSGIEDMGGMRWDLCGCLFAIWVGCYFSIWKGVGWTSKVVYATATLPLIMLLVMVVRGATLDGAGDGIKLYLYPNITRLGDVTVWNEAAMQVFFSYAVSAGVSTALASHNSYHQNFYRDSALLCFLNGISSFICGFAVFSILGFMAKQQGVSIHDVAESGPGLVFISYPAALALLPAPQFWSALFFAVIILLGFDGFFVYQEAVTTTFVEVFPGFLRGRWQREIVVAIACGGMFLLGLSMTMQGGIYVFYIFDYYIVNICVFLFCSMMCITICWIYGMDKYRRNIEDMLGSRSPKIPILYILWKYITPVIGIILFFYNIITYKPLVYNKTYVYPTWATALGWVMSISGPLCVPVYAIYQIAITSGTIFERLRVLTTPNDEFGPEEEEDIAMKGKLTEGD